MRFSRDELRTRLNLFIEWLFIVNEIERIIYRVYGSANIVGATMATIQIIFFGTNKSKTSLKTKTKTTKNTSPRNLFEQLIGDTFVKCNLTPK